MANPRCWAAAGIVLALGIVLTLGTSAASAEPEVTQTIVTYDISGATPAEIRASLDSNGPVDPRSKRRFDAVTRWSVRLQYNHAMDRERCNVTTATTMVEVTTTLPRLKVTAETPAELSRAFKVYTDKLMQHEKGHGGIAVAIARRVEAAVSEHPPRLTCDELGRDVGALANRIIRDEGPRLDAEYDTRTQYGRAQGAIFP